MSFDVLKKKFNKLRNIDRDELTERKFFEAIFEVFTTLKEYDLDFYSKEDASYLKNLLEEIGCVNMDTWIEINKPNKEIFEKSLTLSARDGDLYFAEHCIDKLLNEDYEVATKALKDFIRDGDSCILQMWIDVSQKIRLKEKKKK